MAESVHLNRRGVLFVLSSPSGAGKTTISRMMLEADKDIALSISATTRPPRPGEIDGVHYHFVDTETFKKMAADGEFLEWAHVFGHRYGTPRRFRWTLSAMGAIRQSCATGQASYAGSTSVERGERGMAGISRTG